MAHNIVLTTAEDIVSVVDSVVAKGGVADKSFIFEFTGIATEDQVNKALEMAMELGLLKLNESTNLYHVKSFLAKRLVTAVTDEQKAAVMRIVLEEYEPYCVFKIRYEITKSIELACRQIKMLFSMTSNERDIKNTIISVATYAKALVSEGANLYTFTYTQRDIEEVENVIKECVVNEAALRKIWGEKIVSEIDGNTIFSPLVDSLQKTNTFPTDTRAVIVYAANAFESFLDYYANIKNISLQGKNGILQKRDALSSVLSKKHRGMMEYIGQIRNAADHGGDNNEGGQMWNISNETAIIYPRVVCMLIRAILQRENGIIEV